MSAITHPRQPVRRGAVGGTWWSKAWLRSVEEAAFSEAELRQGRALARSGGVGAITVDDGDVVAAVADRDDTFTVSATVPVLSADDRSATVEVIGSAAGWVAALLAGDLPHPLVEAVEEAGVELLPYAGELGSACSCDAWLDPCPHALAVFTQLGWLIQRDPFVLLHLRGLAREDLLADLHRLNANAHESGPELGEDEDLLIAEEAALRAARELREVAGWDEPSRAATSGRTVVRPDGHCRPPT